MVKHCGVVISLSSGEEIRGSPGDAALTPPVSTLRAPGVTATVCAVPDDLPIDLRAKLLVCLIHFRQVECVKGLHDALFR